MSALAIAAALGACGSGMSTTSPSRLFAHNCQFCHSLNGHPTRRQQGGDLRDLRIDRAAMLEFTREMPTKRRLSSAQVRAIADYVLALERRR